MDVEQSARDYAAMGAKNQQLGHRHGRKTRATAAIASLSLAIVASTSVARAQCASDADCKAGRVCAGGTCADKACTKDADCPGSAICEQGSCRATPSAGPPAAVTSAPPAGGSPAPAPPPPPPAYPTAAPPASGYGTAPARDAVAPTESRGITGLIIAGPIVFGATWLFTIGTTAAISAATESNRTGQNTAYAAIPIAGPLIFLADPDDDTEDYAAVLVGSSVLQLAGVTMFVLGMTIRREVPVDEARVRLAPSVDVGPAAVGPTGFGLNLRVGAERRAKQGSGVWW